MVEEHLRRGVEAGGAQRSGVAVAAGGVHGLPGAALGADLPERGGDGRRLASMDGPLEGGKIPAGEGLGSLPGMRRQDNAARGVGIAGAPFEALRPEGPHQIVELTAGAFDEQQRGALRRVGEDRSVGDPLALDGAAEFAAVPDPRDQVLLPGRVRIDLD
ncbi:hypothetical protein [Streptomyces sp. NRRL S-1521]|uniref:hypothetical protein n=1 Tax=Streptomyces sp. NRRL S-1521 TaxID=1609100 RepID=UPI0007488744|nr:hypothetical protein [Streptomyces sp. NRRL S-1521]KUL53184.1 hypothetical protein ADL30_20790 [Streptomyces sp. NRRL S-1521]